jgi:hypothetical protein
MVISYVISTVVVFIFFVLGVFSLVTVLSNQEGVMYAINNPVYLGTDRQVYINRVSIVTPVTKQVTFDTTMAKGCCELIENVYSGHMDVDDMVLHKSFTYNKTDTIPFCCILTRGDIIFVVFRGSKMNAEWVNNLKFYQNNYKEACDVYRNVPSFMGSDPGIKIHSGHLNVYDRIYLLIMKTVRNLSKSKKYQICFTGHSMGGCMSLILGTEFSFRGFDVVSYVFACPRTGNLEFAKYVDDSSALIYRVVNTEDSVSESTMSVAPNTKNHKKLYFYAHCGDVKYYAKNWFSVSNNHSISIHRSFF